jgi:hypothetical protein
MNGSTGVSFKEFDTLAEAVDFSNKQPINSVLEIKLYDNEARNLQNESYDSRRSGLHK